MSTNPTPAFHDFGVRDSTHRVMVRSTHTKQGDSKTFRIHAPERSNEELSELIKHFIKESQNEGKLREYITFTNEKKKKTHIIMVQPDYSINARKESTRSFRISTPTFNSEEIAKIVKYFLTGRDN